MSSTARFCVLIALLESVCSQIAVLPPLRQLDHDLQSGKIEVLNNTFLLVHDFYYDGLSESAQFRVGNGNPSAAGIPVPANDSYGSLPLHNGENVMIELPANRGFDTIDYLAVWCNNTKTTFGYVLTNETWLEVGNRRMMFPTILHPFRQTSHDVSSGVITLLDQRTISIKSLKYDGEGTSTHFRLGVGTPSVNSTVLPTESGSGTLPRYQGGDLNITLPNHLSLIDFDYLAIWDDKNGSFGHIYFNDVYVDENEFQQYMGIQLDGFDIPEYKLRSGPIVVVSQRMLYVTNFHSPDLQNVYLQVGNDAKPGKGDVTLPNQFGDQDHIRQSKGLNFYITLPDSFDLTGDKNLAIFNRSGNGSSEHYITFNVSSARKENGNPLEANDGRRIVRYPKCCPAGQMMPACAPTEQNLDNSIPVHFANMSHLNDVRMVPERLLYVPYISSPSCPKFALFPGEEIFLMLSTGKFVFADLREIHTADDYCFDVIDNGDGTIGHTAFLCSPDTTRGDELRILLMTCVAISAVSLFLTAATYFLINNNSDDKRGASLAGFSGCMGIAFVCLFITQIDYEEEHRFLCDTLGYIFQFFIVSSLIWLDALCFEVLFYIKYYSTEEIIEGYNKRLTIYSIVSLVLPLIFVIVSLVMHLPVGLMNYNLDQPCQFHVDDQKWLLYSPILLTVTVSMVITCYSYYCYQNMNQVGSTTDGMNSAMWRTVRPEVRKKLMLCGFLVLITAFCWIFEIVTYAFESPWEPLDFIHALQGFLTLLVVLTTGNIWKRLMKILNCCNKEGNNSEAEMQPMTRGNGYV